MPAKKKTTKKKATPRRQKPAVPDYPLPTLAEYAALKPEEKLRLLEVMRDQARIAGGSQLDTLFEKAPELISQGFEMYSRHFGQRTILTRNSMWVHVGVLLVGTIAMAWLGLTQVLDGATIVAILGPLYTYVLINLRYLTGWKIVGDSNAQT